MTLDGGGEEKFTFPSVFMAEIFMAYGLARGYQVNGKRVVRARLVRLVN